MLALTRDSGEMLLFITEDSEVTELIIIKSDGQRVKIGFNAPQPYRVLREDLIEAIV